MTRYIKATINFFTTTFHARRYFRQAESISGAEYCVEEVDSGLVYDSYVLSVRGSNEAISHFIGYLKVQGIEVEEF